jgi:hypothetical protein
MDLTTMRLAETIHKDRLAEAAQARQWAQNSVTLRLSDRVRSALSACLLRWSKRLQAPTPSIAVR